MTIQSDGQYNGPPVTVNQLHDGSWFLNYRYGTSHTIVLGLATQTSTDQGVTWTTASRNTGALTYDVYLQTTPAGNLLTTFDTVGGQQTYSRSVDNGVTWSPISSFSPVPNGYFVTKAFAVGTDMYMVSYNSGSAWMWKSGNDGVTWTRLGEIDQPGETQTSETGACRMGDGRIIAISRATTNAATFAHFSSDLGVTWTAAQDYTSKLGVLSLPQVLMWQGKVVVVGRSYPTRALVVYASADNGVTWTAGLTLDSYSGLAQDGGYCWPLVMDDGRLFVVYYANSTNPAKPDIKSLKIRLN